MSKKSKIACIAILSVIALYILAFAVCNQVYIKNVFDEIYYSEWHPAFFKYTGTDLRNLKGIIWPNDTIYEKDGKWKTYSTQNLSVTMYWIRLSTIPNEWDTLMAIDEAEDDYKASYFYEYDIEKRVLICHFHTYSYDEKGKEIERDDDIDTFFEETGLSYDYLRTHQQLELDKFLEIWFEKNEGLSRFSSDDLGDFTIEFDY